MSHNGLAHRVAAFVFVLCFAASTSLAAGGTLRITGGSLGMSFDGTFSGVLDQLDAKVTPIRPALVTATGITFPVTGGVFQKATRTGEIALAGGFMIETSTSTIMLTSPMISTTATGAVLTFLVTIDGRVLGRTALFNVTLPEKPFGGQLNLSQPLVINDISLTLTEAAATFLNTTLGVTTFTTSTAAGSADLAVTAVKARTIATTSPK
jgi:hypothetical protein